MSVLTDFVKVDANKNRRDGSGMRLMAELSGEEAELAGSGDGLGPVDGA
jgi:hypothetical protein